MILARCLEELIEELEAAPADQITRRAAELLMQPGRWCELVRTYMASLSDDVFVERVLRAHIPHVEPRVFMLYECPERFRIIVHHFDLPVFEQYQREKRIGAHFHHFPFATRLLRGSYHNWIFDNAGSLVKPELTLAAHAKCLAGDVYTLPYDRYHCVLVPEDDTMSLMVRGPAVLDPGPRMDPCYGADRILAARRRMLDCLAQAPEVEPGRLAEFRPLNG